MSKGINRAVACEKKASELNSYVPLHVITEPIMEEEIVKHSVVILTASSLDEQMRINEITHKAGISNLI